jgi:hypothetical protein
MSDNDPNASHNTFVTHEQLSAMLKRDLKLLPGFGTSTTSIERHVKAGEMPMPLRLGGDKSPKMYHVDTYRDWYRDLLSGTDRVDAVLRVQPNNPYALAAKRRRGGDPNGGGSASN